MFCHHPCNQICIGHQFRIENLCALDGFLAVKAEVVPFVLDSVFIAIGLGVFAVIQIHGQFAVISISWSSH
ncbi:hypothetical protein D9M71_701220 [compost metagenome]